MKKYLWAATIGYTIHLINAHVLLILIEIKKPHTHSKYVNTPHPCTCPNML